MYVRRGYVGGGIVGREQTKGSGGAVTEIRKIGKEISLEYPLSLSLLSPFLLIFLLDAVFVGSDAAKRWRWTRLSPPSARSVPSHASRIYRG